MCGAYEVYGAVLSNCKYDLVSSAGWDGVGWDGMGWGGMGWDGVGGTFGVASMYYSLIPLHCLDGIEWNQLRVGTGGRWSGTGWNMYSLVAARKGMCDGV